MSIAISTKVELGTVSWMWEDSIPLFANVCLGELKIEIDIKNKGF